MEALRVRIRRRSGTARRRRQSSGAYHISRSRNVAWATAKCIPNSPTTWAFVLPPVPQHNWQFPERYLGMAEHQPFTSLSGVFCAQSPLYTDEYDSGHV